MSHNTPAAIVNAESVQVQQPTLEVGESANEGSQRPSPPINRSTKGYCRNCRNSIGVFYNSWYRVTGSYYVPALLGSYSISLKGTGKPKAASKGTDLEGCTIQPLSCPHTGCAETPIGFTVITTPSGKGNFRGRDFFKLSRIELQCEIASNQFIVIEPHEDPAPDLLAAEDTPSPSSSNRSPQASSIEAMEVDSGTPFLQQPGYPPMRLETGHYEKLDQREQQPTYAVESDGQPLKASPASMHSPFVARPLQTVIQEAQGNAMSSPSPATETIRGNKMPYRKPVIHSTRTPLESQSILPRSQSPREMAQPNGHQYPKAPVEVSIDAIERLQTQISQNSGALAAHTRDIRHGEESFQKLEETLRREFQAQLFRQSTDIQRVEESAARMHHEMQGQRPNIQDSALELMAQQIATISHKASEVENLKLHIEIMKNKIYRLEEDFAAGPSQVTSQGPGAPHSVLNVQHHQPPALGASSSKAALETPQRTEPSVSQSSGWATTNAGVKRNTHDGLESPHEAIMDTSRSPKRQRLDDAEHHTRPAASQFPPSCTEADKSGPRFSTPAHTMSSEHTVAEAVQSSQPQHPPYFPYTTEHGPLDDSWRSEGQRTIEHRPRGRGRGRGGGPGSRGGRVRKSMPAQLHGTPGPEWEKEDWQNVPGSQASSDGFSDHIARAGRGGIARRGNGGGGSRGGYASSERATSLGLQGVTAGISFGSPSDLYNSGKRTRTKPIRNADGILIRKDGRPDMRSQSSAANLRKVHARKDGESSHSPTSTTLPHASSADAPDTPSPSGYAADPDATDRHNVIMSKMFPSGLDASRKEHDFARQVFAENGQHSIHTRTHNHHSGATKSTHVKKEQVERNRLSGVQVFEGQDVDMDGTDQPTRGGHPSPHGRSESREVQHGAQGQLASTSQARTESAPPGHSQNTPVAQAADA
ncbi:fe-s protein assembly co-chaperone protein [Stemphylium lycopersici]|nr:fe-s protein assembly co-chaperone protein [Stemphylium lycopersici]